jgi:mono/diheme cytochrome c family protein
MDKFARMNGRFLLIITTLLTALLIGGCSFSLAADITPPPGAEQVAVSRTQVSESTTDLYPLVPPNAARGKSIYVEKCAPCHGISGEGDGPRAAQLSNPVPALASIELSRQTSPARWYEIVTRGNLDRFMPPFPSLSDSQRWDVVAYALSLSSQQATIAEGQQLYQEKCAGCHGVNGKGDGVEAGSLPKAPTNLTDLAFSATRTGVDLYSSISIGISPAMPAFGNELSQAERWALVDYLRSLNFTIPAEQALEQSPWKKRRRQVSISPPPSRPPFPLPRRRLRSQRNRLRNSARLPEK